MAWYIFKCGNKGFMRNSPKFVVRPPHNLNHNLNLIRILRHPAAGRIKIMITIKIMSQREEEATPAFQD